jgi:predicted nucleic acid-binding protein
MVYVDSSVFVALIVNEQGSAAAGGWYDANGTQMVSAAWCITEVASALGQKQRMGLLDAGLAENAWARFESMAASEVQLIPVEFTDFHASVDLMQDGVSGLRAGDALHLACARRLKAETIATLDRVMAHGAERFGMQIVPGLLEA